MNVAFISVILSCPPYVLILQGKLFMKLPVSQDDSPAEGTQQPMKPNNLSIIHICYEK